MPAPWGTGTGGSTAIYGAQLERFTPADFEPRANFPDVRDANLPERWPITYDELAPYYRLAEAIYRVRGTQDPLNPDPQASLLPPPLPSANGIKSSTTRSESSTCTLTDPMWGSTTAPGARNALTSVYGGARAMRQRRA